jgi:hypothetical protein
MSCDPGLTPVQGSVGYVPRNGRCEGLYVSPVAVRGGLELLSLTMGRLEYELEPGGNLAIAVNCAGLEADTVNVRALAAPLRTYYRMDTVLSSGQPWAWPVDDVLLPLNLTSSRLGIYSWAETGSGKVFVPVAVNRPGAAEIHLSVRATSSVQNVMWRSGSPGQGRAGPWQTVAERSMAGERIPIVMSGVHGGLMEVEVAAVSGDGAWTRLRIKVWCE